MAGRDWQEGEAGEMNKPPNKKMGRPLKPISEGRVFKLASIGLTYGEIAVVEECDPSTLTKRLSHVIKKGHERRNASLRRKQFEVAMSGNVGMLVWLGKQYLDQRDKQEVTNGPDPLAELLKEFSTRNAQIQAAKNAS
ncbi:MAG TPA: hypothetical protein VMV42_00385 [archaeon]|nr:hypothetical protein [archaeon]